MIQFKPIGAIHTPFIQPEGRPIHPRAPRRPNPIGLSVVRLLRLAGGVLHVQNVDILDGTPLLDIKPYVPEFDSPTEIRTGWLEQARQTAAAVRSDARFT